MIDRQFIFNAQIAVGFFVYSLMVASGAGQNGFRDLRRYVEKIKKHTHVAEHQRHENGDVVVDVDTHIWFLNCCLVDSFEKGSFLCELTQFNCVCRKRDLHRDR